MIRTRFAPSPTGFLHIGNARTALFNFLYAKKNNGIFVLRIEDTDIERSSKKYEEQLIEDLRWLGISWDEGPDIGGSFPPYRQSEKLSIYKEYAERLLREGNAYHCYCTEEELRNMRAELLKKGRPPKYDGRCQKLTNDKKTAYEREGRKPAVRFNSAGISGEDIIFDDAVKGRISFGQDAITDFVILRSDGVASYNLAVVIDDAMMEITHVIRGDDHLSNTPKQISLYKTLKLKPPSFAHLPMILGDDRKPLSKRYDDISILRFKKEGFLKEGILNYISLLGWSHRDKKEILSLDEIIHGFHLEDVSKSPALFDIKKFEWVNKQYIHNIDINSLSVLLAPYMNHPVTVESSVMAEFLSVVKENISRLSEVAMYEDIFLKDRIDIKEDSLAALRQQGGIEVLNAFRANIIELDKIDDISYQAVISRLKGAGFSGKKLFMPIRAALTGLTHGPELIHILSILGKDVVIKRVDDAIRLI